VGFQKGNFQKIFRNPKSEVMKIFLIFLALPALLTAQNSMNLLLNAGFEDENICPEYNARCAPEGWWEANLKESDYFSQHKIAHTGNRSAAFTVMHYQHGNTKTYLYTRLACPLEQGKHYKFHFWLRVPTFEMREIGIYWSTTDVLGNFNPDLTLKPHLSFVKTDAKPKYKPNEWGEFSKTFIAKGGEKYLIIGNFEPDNPKIHGRHSLKIDRLLYHLDDASLILMDSVQSQPCEIAKIFADSMYKLNFRHILPKSQIPAPVAAQVTTRPTSLPVPRKSAAKSDTLTIPNIVFAHNSDVIEIPFQSVLDSMIQKIEPAKIRRVEIIGHTDDHGSDDYNQKLSLRRAHAISNYLINKQLKIPNIACIGRGESQPVADNVTESGRQRNRRVEIVLFFR
jgi:outer membrane protein OmpA-like peptidoglycan-associated protein